MRLHRHKWKLSGCAFWRFAQIKHHNIIETCTICGKEKLTVFNSGYLEEKFDAPHETYFHWKGEE